MFHQWIKKFRRGREIRRQDRILIGLAVSRLARGCAFILYIRYNHLLPKCRYTAHVRSLKIKRWPRILYRKLGTRHLSVNTIDGTWHFAPNPFILKRHDLKPTGGMGLWQVRNHWGIPNLSFSMTVLSSFRHRLPFRWAVCSHSPAFYFGLWL